MKQLIMKLKHNQDVDFVDNAYAVLEVDDRLEKMLKEYSELIKGKDSVHCLTICCDADYELQMEFEETEFHQLHFSGTKEGDGLHEVVLIDEEIPEEIRDNYEATDKVAYGEIRIYKGGRFTFYTYGKYCGTELWSDSVNIDKLIAGDIHAT